jgi:ABC-type antimicrobial peptide transport system permease subunit
MGLIMREGLALSLAGVAFGLAGTMALGRVLAGLVFDVDPTDPFMLAALATMVLVVSLAASLLPARRALRLDPVTALKEE